MTEKEAIEELKEQIKTAESMISFNADFEPEHDNSVLENKIKTAKTAISAIEEIQQYRAIGTIEECREARKRQKIEEDADPVRQMVSIPSTDEAFKSALHRATNSQIRQALKRMDGKNGKRSRIYACMGELKKRRKEQEKALAAYKTIQNHCNNRETCDGCLFEMEDGTPGVCIMEFQDIPAEWQELELDEPAAYK